MKRLLCSLFFAAMFTTAALPGIGFADEVLNPLFGTWLLNCAKSTFIPAPGPKGQMRAYAPAGDGEKLTARGIDAEGKMTLVQYTAKYDGRDYAITGSSGGNLISLRRIDKFTTQSTQKRDGKAVIVATRTVSKDGKTLTVLTKGTTAKGEVIDSVMVFDRR
jgi:hypothetical protein